MNVMIVRANLQSAIRKALRRERIVAILGPRQCGKTTLARSVAATLPSHWFDLEDPADIDRLQDPAAALRPLRGLVVIDEIQLRPDLFPLLRVLADRHPGPARFLILGSASPTLVRHASESLAGRLETIIMGGFSLRELPHPDLEPHWLRGGFPRSFLAPSRPTSFLWRRQFLQTLFQRDLARLTPATPTPTLQRFWAMLAHCHGQVWNGADPARSLGVSEPTIRRYLDLLEGVFLIRILKPWHANLGKRQVRSPKVYIRDSGLLHCLFGIRTIPDLLSHPRCGASWEGYLIEEVCQAVQPDEACFWATHTGAELDLLLIKDGRRVGVECKRATSPGLTPSMRIALQDLDLERLIVLHGGKERYALAGKAIALPATDLADPSFPTRVFPTRRPRSSR